jgi:hypothetical protein
VSDALPGAWFMDILGYRQHFPIGKKGDPNKVGT